MNLEEAVEVFNRAAFSGGEFEPIGDRIRRGVAAVLKEMEKSPEWWERKYAIPAKTEDQP